MRWHAHYDEVTTSGGMVTAPEEPAAEAGAAILRQGGNAVDAAVAAAFVLGVVEPEMSGLGGGTMMTITMGGRTTVVDGATWAPLAATPEEFPLAETPVDKDWAVSFYDWPAVAHARNALGPPSVGVPGTVAALIQAHDRFGKLARSEVMEPAIAVAADGFEIHWFLAALIASNARSLARDEGCEKTFLRGGLPLRGPDVRRAHRLVQPELAETLAAIAEEGPEVFYEGRIGASLVEYVQRGGGLLRQEDLARVAPYVVEDVPSRPHRGLDLVGPPVSGFPSVMQVLGLVEAAERRGIDDEAVRWALASKIAMVDRFLHMSADADDGTPWEGLLSPSYLRDRLEAEIVGAPSPGPAGGVGDPRPASAPAGGPSPAGGFTSQHSVVDASGDAVSVTQTVLNTFGARVLDPRTGVLLNDGMAYFDPRPGNRNGIRPGARAFSGMSPTIALRDGRVVASFGASGGRRIITGVAQMARDLADGSSMQEAVETPRLYAESDVVLLDVRWPDGAAEALRHAAFTVEPTDEQPTTVHFARPNGILVDHAGTRRSGVDPKKPGAAATAEVSTP